MRAGRGAAFLALGLAAWTASVVLAGEAELDASDRALDAGDPHEAIVCARRAARWYAPGAPHVGHAYRRLIALARGAEERRRRELALLAWRGVRSAALETRWVVTPHAEELALAEAEIARLLALAAHDAAAPDPDIGKEQLRAMRGYEPPRVLCAVGLVLGLATAGIATIVFVRRAALSGGRLDLRRGRSALVIAAIGAAAWLISVWQA